MTARRPCRTPSLAVATAVLVLVTACGGAAADGGQDGARVPDASPRVLDGTLDLGFFPNVTHAPALVGLETGAFARALGDGVELNAFTFDAGTDVTEALFAGAVDIAFVGASPAVNAWVQSEGAAIRIISGAASGGAFLVVRPEITSVEQLEGLTLATPSLGSTQDIALRAWLRANGLETTPEGGGDVSILPQSNATTYDAFIAGSIDGAWLPEPWSTRLIRDGGARVLVDERDLWPETRGEFVTTQVVVRAAYLEDHPDLVTAFLRGFLDALDLIAADPVAAQAAVIARIRAITNQDLSPEVVAAGFANLTFTADPIAASLERSADAARRLGLLDPFELDGIHDLTLLNELLAERGVAEVTRP